VNALAGSIAAIATAPGAAGLAVVRVSGADAIGIADGVFRASRPLAAAAGHTLHHGWAVSPAAGDTPETRLDEVVAAVFRAPRSYTGENVVELSCHGGGVPARRVLAALVRAGARLAGPGEFTLRAFLHGRLDLAQAEAVADLVHAETESAGDLALAQLAGQLSRRLAAIEERVTDAVAEVEARVDFAEDVGGIETPPHVRDAIAGAAAELTAMLAGAPWARALREGVHVPLVGRPNAGKSSLFNALLGEDRAIVTPEPGTTRDRLSERIEIAGVPVTLSDTAGVRPAASAVEEMGVERALATLEGAPVVLWVVDRAAPFAANGDGLHERLAGRRVLVALNKSDLPARTSAGEVLQLLHGPARAVEVSSLSGAGLESLRESLAELIGVDRAGGFGAAVANPRHAEALARARAALDRAAAAAEGGAPGEIVALELRESLAAIGEVTGRNASEELLERIFARFCIGK